MKRINCDVFMKDGSILDLNNKVICITGNFYAGNNCSVSTAIVAGGDVIFEDFADTVGIFAEGNVSIGAFSNCLSIGSSKNISLEDYTYANHVFADEDINLGYHANGYTLSARGDINVDKKCKPKTFFRKLWKDMKYVFFSKR